MPDEKKFYLSADSDAACCIQREIGYFKAHKDPYESLRVNGDTEKEVAQAMVEKIIENVQSSDWGAYGFQIRFLWFKDPVDYKGNHSGIYQFAHLRDAVMAHEYAQHLGTWVNGNTGNKMDGWMLVIPVEKSNDDDD